MFKTALNVRLVRLTIHGLVLLSAALFFHQAFLRYQTFHNTTFDLALYARMAWGYVHAEVWDPIIGALFFGEHLSFVLIPLGILGAFFGTVPVLLAAQSCALALTAYPFARMAERRLGSVAAAIVVVAWFAYPNLSHVATEEFHPGTLAVLPLAWALDALDRNHRNHFVCAMLAVLACREDLALVLILLCAVAWLRQPQLRETSLKLSVGAGIYFAVFIFVLHPLFAPKQGSLELHFGEWGKSIVQVVSYVLSHPLALWSHILEAGRWYYPILILLPVGFLALLRPMLLLPTLPILGMNMLSHFPGTTGLDSHYLTVALPFLFGAALEGCELLADFGFKHFALLIWLFASSVAHVVYGGTPWASRYQRQYFVEDDRSRSARKLLTYVPKTASVQAPYPFLPHLAERKHVHPAPPPDRGADFIILDLEHRRVLAQRESLLRSFEEPEVRNWFARPNFAPIARAGRYVLLQRDRSPRNVLARYFEHSATSAEQTIPLTSCLSIERASVTKDRELQLVFHAHSSCSHDLALRIGAEPKPTRVDLLFDGMFSPVHLRGGDVIRSQHSATPTEMRAIQQHGLYLGLIRSSGARVFPSDPQSVKLAIQEDAHSR